MLENTDRKRFLNILICHPFLENDRKRCALLINCGLEHLLSELETAGSSRDFVHLLYAPLTRNLTMLPSETPWLISLLTYLLTPTIIPRKDESNRKWPGDVALQQWLLQRDGYHVGHERQKYEDLCLSIHQDLLGYAEEMRYPLTSHILQALERAQHRLEQSWQQIWQDYLTSQMNLGQYTSYQESALLWGILFSDLKELKKIGISTCRAS